MNPALTLVFLIHTQQPEEFPVSVRNYSISSCLIQFISAAFGQPRLLLYNSTEQQQKTNLQLSNIYSENLCTFSIDWRFEAGRLPGHNAVRLRRTTDADNRRTPEKFNSFVCENDSLGHDPTTLSACSLNFAKFPLPKCEFIKHLSSALTNPRQNLSDSPMPSGCRRGPLGDWEGVSGHPVWC